MDAGGAVLQVEDMPSSGFVLTRPVQFGGQELSYTTTLANNATLVIHYALFSAPTVLNYGGLDLTVYPNSSKWYVNISDWPFQDAGVALRLVLQLSSADGAFTGLEYGSVDLSLDSGEDDSLLRSAVLSTAGSTVVVDFPTFCLIDSMDGDSRGDVSTSVTSINSGDQVSFVFNFPRFSSFMYYDPSIGVLVSDNSDPGSSGTSDTGGLSSGQLALYIGLPLAVVFFCGVGLMIGVVYLLQKRDRIVMGMASIGSVNFSREGDDAVEGERSNGYSNSRGSHLARTLRRSKSRSTDPFCRNSVALEDTANMTLSEEPVSSPPTSPKDSTVRRRGLLTQNALYENSHRMKNPLYTEEDGEGEDEVYVDDMGGGEVVRRESVAVPASSSSSSGSWRPRFMMWENRRMGPVLYLDEEDVIYSDGEKEKEKEKEKGGRG